MPRIFKGSESTLRLLISKCDDTQTITSVKVLLYTTDINNAIEVIDGITLEGNVAEINLSSRAFLGMEDGMISYKVEGVVDGDIFITERQSNYYLKTLSHISENGATTQELYITENGEYKITPNDSAYVNIKVNVIGYEEGYTEGYNIGWSDGFGQGEDEGYNNGYDNGYGEGFNNGDAEGYNRGLNEAGEVISATAEVLDATSNGTYYTQYADVPEWTEPETGDGEFYSYITAQKNALSTGYKGDTNTVVELWYRHYGDVSNGAIVQRASYSNAFKLMLTEETGTLIIGSNSFDFYLPAHQFNKIRFSTKGIWVNDEQVSEFDVEYTNESPIWEIGGAGNLAQGDYGMIKIDGNVYIPTADGFLDTVTNEILPNVSSSAFVFTFTEVTKPVIYENLFKQVNVNFKLSVEETSLKLAYSDCKSIPDFIDFSNISGEILYNFFNSAKQLEDVSRLEGIDTSEITSLEGIFYNCTNLTDITPIGTWDTSNVKRMYNMFGGCTKLTTIPALDCSSVDTTYNSTAWFNTTNMTALTDIGGFINLKTSSDSLYGLNRCPNLTYESCINILNGLYDFTGNGETPKSNQGKLKVHQNFLDLVGDEITIGTNKGWTISA